MKNFLFLSFLLLFSSFMSAKAEEETCLDYGVPCDPDDEVNTCCFPLRCKQPYDDYLCLIRYEYLS